MKDFNHNFDKEVKQALENFEMPYQPDDWQLMKTKLDAANETNRPTVVVFPGRRIIKLVLAGTLFLIFAGAGINYKWQNNTRLPGALPTTTGTNTELLPPTDYANTTPPATKHPAQVQPISGKTVLPNAANGSAHSEKTDQYRATSGNTPMSGKLLQPNNNTAIRETTAKSVQTTGLISKASRFATAIPPTAIGINNTATFTTLPPAQSTPGSAAKAAGKHTGPAAATLLPNQQLPPQVLETIKAQQLPLPPQKIIIPALQQPITAQPVLVAAPAPRFPESLPRFAIAGLTAADANWLEGKSALAGTSSGMQFSYRFAQHWSVAAGAEIGYKKMNYTLYSTNSNMQLDPTTTDTVYLPENYNSSKVQALLEMNLLEIPVAIQYHLFPNKRFSPFAGVGFSVYLPFKNMLTYNGVSNGMYTYSDMSPQNLLANTPFTPDPRPISNNNPDNDPLVNNPNIYDIEQESTINSNTLNAYWVNSLPNYQSSLTANAVVQERQVSEINRPLYDVVHISVGMNYKLTNRLHLAAATRLKGTILRHRFYNQPQTVGLGQRLFTASVQIGVAYSFK